MVRKVNKTGSELKKLIFLFLLGGCAYGLIEILFRGYTHWTMILLGGACFLLIGMINEVIPWEMPLISQMFISMCIVTAAEFIFGVILNIVLKMGIWDYSEMPYNVCGQICLLFSIAWFFSSVVAIIVDDLLRWLLFGERKPTYRIFFSNTLKE